MKRREFFLEENPMSGPEKEENAVVFRNLLEALLESLWERGVLGPAGEDVCPEAVERRYRGTDAGKKERTFHGPL